MMNEGVFKRDVTMTAWEYMTIIFRSENVNGALVLSIFEVNGEDASFRDDKGAQCYYEVHEYLELLGKEGWEVTGVTPLNISATGNIKTSVIILKRKE